MIYLFKKYVLNKGNEITAQIKAVNEKLNK